MCDHTSARAVSLEHGAAHDADHAAWTRRDFLVRAGLGTATALTLGASRAYAFSGGSLLRRLAAVETDRVLVLLQLAGGNDGLNTIVPVRNDVYYQRRPTLALPRSQTLALSDDIGMHPALAPLQGLWGNGQMAVVHAVGYDAPSLSHFASTDIWATARGDGGWGGRALRTEVPQYEETPPDHPPAVQIGANNPLLFQSGESDLSMRLTNAAVLDQVVASGTLFDPDDVPATGYGPELSFVRTLTNASYRYLGVVQDAGTKGANGVAYPGTALAANLAAVARLIKGGLQSRIYLVSLGGFDTHAAQLTRQEALLTDLAGAVAAFYADLAASGHDQRVMTMTFSEFGRRVQENGNAGTDHGTAAPLFAFGPGVAGGFYGTPPDLTDLDGSGNVRFSTDFRSAYAAVLGPWMGLDTGELATVLGGSYDPVGFVGHPTAGGSGEDASPLSLDAPFPNPARDRAQVRFALPTAGAASLVLYDVRGRALARLADGLHAAGPHTAAVDASGLPAGTYVLRLTTPGGSATTRLTVAR